MGAKLRAAREAAGMTQTALAEASGVSRALINRMECDALENVTVKTLTRIASALGKTVQEIFFPACV